VVDIHEMPAGSSAEPDGFGDHRAAEIFAGLALELHGVDGVEETVEAVVQFALQAGSRSRWP
jgi:hypothetical protein